MEVLISRARELLSTICASFQGALVWWLGELRAMVPSGLRRRLGFERPVLRATVAAEALTLMLHHHGQDQGIYHGPLDAAAVEKALSSWRHQLDVGAVDTEVVLDPGDVLVRRIELPEAAERRLADALNFELSRHTPFSPADVYMAWQIGKPQNNRLPVRLAVVARDHIANLAERLRQVDLTPAYASSGDIRFKSGGNALGRRPALLSVGLLSTVSALAFLLMTVEVDRQDELLARVNAELAGERQSAIEVERWKTELVQADRRRQFFGAKIEDKHISLVLARLSSDLPDTIWLQQLTLQNGEVRLYGYAPEPATVIDALESSGYFGGARFRSPSTRRNGASVDRFDISAQIKKGGGS
jgi:general secretion pathway protein L